MTGFKVIAGAIRPEEMQDAVVAEEILDAHASAKVGQVRAAAHADVLAMIDQLARGGIAITCGPAAQATSCLEQFDVSAGLGERHRGRQSG